MLRTRPAWRSYHLPLQLEVLEGRDLPSLLGNAVFPADNPWNQRVDAAPVAANSTTLIASIGANSSLRADFGASLWEGGQIGIPYNIVSATQPKVTVVLDAYASESDQVPVPIPPNALIEGDPKSGAQNTGDRHLLVYDRDNNILYEGFNVHKPTETTDGHWHADALAVWDLRRNHFRPPGWTSADAAGLPILPGLVRAEEIAEQGRIDHAIRVTVPRSRNQYVFPASHFAGSNNDALPRMGERFRLRPDFDISGYSPTNQVILRALKEYGLIVADNGSAWYMSGVPSGLWSDSELRQLMNVHGSDFQAVDLTPRLSGIGPLGGPPAGGFQVTIDGLNFAGGAGQTQVFFGTVPATNVTVRSDTQLVVTAPAQAAGPVQVTISSPYGRSASVAAGTFTYAEGAPPPAPPPTPLPSGFRFTARTFHAGERDGTAVITVLRTGALDGSAAVDFATGSGIATPGADYTAAAGTLSFGPGEMSKSFSVTLQDDTAVEGRETIRLMLSNPAGGPALGAPARATLVLRDDDGTATGRFVAQVYQDVLGRPAEHGGVVGWTSFLGQGGTPAQVVAAVVSSAEYRTNIVRMAYQRLLGRNPEPVGLAAWAEYLRQGGTEEELQAGLLGSEEFFSRGGGTNLGFLEALYSLVLGRSPESAGAHGWDQILQRGTPRGAVALAVLFSDENLRREAEDLYDRLLVRTPDAGGIEAFVTALRQKTRRDIIYAVMAGSEEYLAGCQ